MSQLFLAVKDNFSRHHAALEDVLYIGIIIIALKKFTALD